MSETFVERALTFDCAGERLIGVISIPRASANIGVVVVVGGPQYRVGSHRQFALLARALASAGYPVLRFDARGMGDSDGVFPGFEALGADVSAATQAFRAALPEVQRLVLWGLCDAASAVAIEAPRVPHLAGLVLLNPWVRNAQTLERTQVKHYYFRRLREPDFWRKLVAGRLPVASASREFAGKLLRMLKARHGTVRAKDGADPGDFRDRMLAGLQAFAGPVLLVLSGRDYVAAEFLEYQGCNPGLAAWCGAARVHRVDLPEADHTFSNRESRYEVECVTRTWLDGLARELA